MGKPETMPQELWDKAVAERPAFMSAAFWERNVRWLWRLDQVARLIWENGEGAADWEGGRPPTWEEIKELALALPTTQEDTDAREAAAAAYQMKSEHEVYARTLLEIERDDHRELLALLAEHEAERPKPREVGRGDA